MALTREDRASEAERRFVTIGLDPMGRLVVVVYTHRGEVVRLISARRVTRKERHEYEEGVRF